jgi:WD40 repeat protein
MMETQNGRPWWRGRRQIRLYNAELGVHLRFLTEPEQLSTQKTEYVLDSYGHCIFSPDDKLVATIDDKTDTCNVSVWDVRSGKKLHSFAGHGSRIHSLAFSPDSSLLANKDMSGKINLWRVQQEN